MVNLKPTIYNDKLKYPNILFFRFENYKEIDIFFDKNKDNPI